MASPAKALASPLRRYFGPRFDALSAGIGGVSARIDALDAQMKSMSHLVGRGRQAEFLDRVDVTDHNRDSTPAGFDSLVSRAASAADCDDETYLAWWRLLENLPDNYQPDVTAGPHRYNRKVWEWAFIAQAATQHGLMSQGHTAVGFGVGSEPLPALFASKGVEVLATDQASDEGEHWAATGELMTGLGGLSRPYLLDDADLAARVRTRNVNMNAVPDDLGQFDVAWSSCVIEHLGSPERGLDFVLESCELLKPGGIAVHTTELELTRKQQTADYGNCAVYRLQDLQQFARRVEQAGYEARFNYHVGMDHPADRWISLVGSGLGIQLVDRAHLKLVIGDSVSTSYGLLIRKPK